MSSARGAAKVLKVMKSGILNGRLQGAR